MVEKIIETARRREKQLCCVDDVLRHWDEGHIVLKGSLDVVAIINSARMSVETRLLECVIPGNWPCAHSSLVEEHEAPSPIAITLGNGTRVLASRALGPINGNKFYF